ncbi:hypothetical protein GGI12_006205, partial [Dipsacomyces acuminosporus]
PFSLYVAYETNGINKRSCGPCRTTSYSAKHTEIKLVISALKNNAMVLDSFSPLLVYADIMLCLLVVSKNDIGAYIKPARKMVFSRASKCLSTTRSPTNLSTTKIMWLAA